MSSTGPPALSDLSNSLAPNLRRFEPRLARILLNNPKMSQIHVERLVGKLITDEPFRREFSGDPGGALFRQGLKLTEQELRCILSIDAVALASMADQFDPRLIRGCVDMEKPWSNG